jgi:phospholipase C
MRNVAMNAPRLRRLYACTVVVLAFVWLAGCGQTAPRPTEDVAATERRLFKHVIIVVQENRSFDNLFHGLPNADAASYGRVHTGRTIALRPIGFDVRYDIAHSVRSFLTAYDHGRMDAFDLVRVGPGPGATGKAPAVPYPQYGYLPRAEVAPYFDMAAQYAVADHMFQSNLDQSFSAHLFLIAGKSGGAVNIPSGRPWGCDANAGSRVPWMDHRRRIARKVFPCFPYTTLGDELDGKAITWRYYAPKIASPRAWRDFTRAQRAGFKDLRNVPHPEFGGLWSSYDAIDHVRYGSDWDTNVVSPETSILSDVKRGDLAAMNWVVPSFKNSDHALSHSTSGPDWVASIVNAVGTSKYWKDTVIFVTWDDSGGWYDHVAPPQIDFDGLGCRVPLIVVSAYTKRGVVTHHRYEFGSLLKFAENVFDVSALANSDRRADRPDDVFDFTAPPRHFVPIAVRRSQASFIAERSPGSQPPDDD